jgi:class 3 adenylate cyclase
MIHQKHFVYKQLLEQATVGEFRTVVSCFINFLNVDFLLRHFLELNEFIVQNGGYLNKIIHDDKGYQMLVLFGAPVTTEEIANRSANFVLQVKNFGGKNVRVGFSMGTVFAGFVGNKERCEYTALGTEVNKSARLMMIADWGDALTDSHIKAVIYF